MAETSLDPTPAAGDPDFVPPTPELLYERRGAVAFLTFNRPAARNAMTFAMYEGLYAACEHVDADDRVRVFVLRGAGNKAFVAGTDISQFQAFSTAADALGYEQKINRYLGRLEAVRKPTIAAIRGYCVGGGAVIALACDLRLASADARFGVPVARTLGNTLATQNVGRMVALLGDGLTKELLFTARLLEADEGKAVGLYNEVVPAERLEARTLELAEQIAANAPLTLRSIKEAVRRIREQGRLESADDLVLMCYLSEDFKEGVSAFLEKRPPRWQGR
ncbi:MAG TPA: enoyl-CoA hydratase/isomerase family protein [Chloroflexota bacterium]|nr:enoyl-CoA hydratase/isomerase family protein [Chloroflexota bacterium]